MVLTPENGQNILAAGTDLFLLTAHAQEEGVETVGVGVSLYSHPARRLRGPSMRFTKQIINRTEAVRACYLFFLILFEGLWGHQQAVVKKINRTLCLHLFSRGCKACRAHQLALLCKCTKRDRVCRRWCLLFDRKVCGAHRLFMWI